MHWISLDFLDVWPWSGSSLTLASKHAVVEYIVVVDRQCLTNCNVYTELVTTLAEAQPVSALTVLDGELYLARSASHNIDVFDVKSFSLRRHMTVTSVQRTLLAIVSLGRASGFTITDMTSCR